MATEEDALRTLQNIEKILKSASALAGNRQPFSTKMQQSQKDRADKEARKAFKAVASSGKEVNDSFVALTKSLTGLNDEVDGTTKNFSALNSQLAKFMGSLQPISSPETQSITFDTAGVATAINHWGSLTVKGIEDLALAMSKGAVVQQQQGTGLFGIFGRMFKRQNQPASQGGAGTVITPAIPALEDNDIPLRSVLSRFSKNLGMAGASAGGLTYTFEKLIDASMQMTADFYQLSRLGMGSFQNLKDVYLYAAEAGMSFKEYNALIKDSITVVSKAGTLENFNAIISAQDNVLAGMGIFGVEARQFQANLAQASASAGVSVNDLTSATAAQVKMFDHLRKTTNLTAEEFSKLVSSVATSADAQRELVGLAPQERIARLQELTQLQTVGLQFGMTADASKQLGDALLKQRQATVKERFDQGASLLQLGAFTGNGGMGQRAYELNLKGRNRTSSEDAELLDIVQTLDKTSQSMYQNGSLGMQNALDSFDDMINKGSLGDLVRQGRGATLAKDSGKQNQEAFGQHVNEFGQAVGKMLAWTEGFKNSIAAPLTAAVGAAVLTTFRGPLLGMLGKMLGRGGAASAGADVAELSQAGAGMQGLEAVQGMLPQVLVGFSDAIEAGMGLFAKTGPLAGLFGAAVELFTGEISDALNPSGGMMNRLGGIVTAFFTAIPQMIIDLVGWVFGENAQKRMQNGFDIFVATVNGSIKYMLSMMLDGWTKIFSWILPDDAKITKKLAEWTKGLGDSATENFNAAGTMLNDSSQNLSTLATQNQQTAKAQTTATDTATSTATAAQKKFNDVMMASQVSTAGLISDAATLASPAAQVQRVITPSTVNTSTATADASVTPTAVATASPNGDVLNTLQAMLKVLTDMLNLEKQQTDNSDQLLSRLSRPNVAFQSAEEVAGKLLKRY